MLTACVAWSCLSTLGEEELVFGHSAAGQIRVEAGFDGPLDLPVSVFPGIPGYATGEVGFHSTILDEPANDFFQFSTAADLRFVLLAKDPGMEVWNDTGSGYMAVGDTFFIGQAPFDTHPVWNLVHGTAGNSYSLSVKIRDLNGIYTESDPFVVSFTPVLPVIAITPAPPGFLTISWVPATAGIVLQYSPTALPGTWTNAPSGATNPITLPLEFPARFYRVTR